MLECFDEETGLHYNRFRYFDPDLGMFTTRDPIGLMGGNNVFQYAPNPTGWIDPFGLKANHTYYQLKDANGRTIYHGITERPIQERLAEHHRDGKTFSQVSYLDNLNSRIDARNLEGSALFHDRNVILQNRTRPVTPGYYHSYDPNNLKSGRTFLSQADIDEKMKKATTVEVKEGKIQTKPCT